MVAYQNLLIGSALVFSWLVFLHKREKKFSFFSRESRKQIHYNIYAFAYVRIVDTENPFYSVKFGDTYVVNGNCSTHICSRMNPENEG